MSAETLFDLPEEEDRSPSTPTSPEEARVLRPVRNQVEMIMRDLDSLVSIDHPARSIWGLLEKLDLSEFYGSIKAVLTRPGRSTTDPRVLLAVWLLATVESVSSSRKLERLCQEHDAYRWLCGGVPINYHMLSDFRTAHREALDGLLTQIVGSLMAAGAVTLEGVAQDGMRVRASAGAASFRRRETLEACLEAARKRVARLSEEREHPDPRSNLRDQRSRERVAREREQRVKAALGLLPEAKAAKERQERTLATPKKARVTQPRVSTTDPEASIMRQPDGGFRPAYNVGLATDKASGVIVGVDVTSEGTDAGHAPPMEEQVANRTAQHPRYYLVDGGFAILKDITVLEQRGVTVYAPVRLPQNKPKEERYQARYGDSKEVVRWRERMSTAKAKELYRQRGATAEWSNAQVRHHGVGQFTVRGVAKVTTVMLMVVVAHNLLRWAALGV